MVEKSNLSPVKSLILRTYIQDVMLCFSSAQISALQVRDF